MGKRIMKAGVIALLIFLLGLEGYSAEETPLEEMVIEDETMERKTEMVTAAKAGGITEAAELTTEETATEEEEIQPEGFALPTETNVYSYTDDFNDIYVKYPQIIDMEDKEKQQRINALIKEDIEALFVAEEESEFASRYYVNIYYVVKFLNENVISIFYLGQEGFFAPSEAPRAFACATTIDINDEKIIRLNEVVTDMDALTSMLLGGDFKNITAWDGIPMPGQYPLSSQLLYGGYGESAMENLREDLASNSRTNIREHAVDWYTDEENFVVVSYKVYGLYNEYAISIWEIQDILNEDFLEKLED